MRLGFWGLMIGCMVWDCEFSILDSGFWVLGWGFGFEVWGLESGAWSLGFGPGFYVSRLEDLGSDFRV